MNSKQFVHMDIRDIDDKVNPAKLMELNVRRQLVELVEG